jgi:CRP-like cAMP-binding protein
VPARFRVADLLNPTLTLSNFGMIAGRQTALVVVPPQVAIVGTGKIACHAVPTRERIAAFLLEMAERKPGGAFVELPMSRQDIADYLGLTIETVSRTLTQLEHQAAIAVPSSRRIVLRNRAALSELNA